MYGLVNRAIEQLVTSTRGADGWRRVRERAGVAEEGFVAVQSYPDEVTYRLVDAVSAELGQPTEQVLEAFGEYWILYTAEQGYGDLMRAGGLDLVTFLAKLNDMHGRIETTFQHLAVPYFEIEPLHDGRFELLYESPREGLAPMVVGLLRGLAKRFGQAIEIDHVQRRTPARPHDRFHLRVAAA
jgi:hypothetical protein